MFPRARAIRSPRQEGMPLRDKNFPSVVASVRAQQPVFAHERSPKQGRVQVEHKVCPTYQAGPYRRRPSPSTRVSEDARDPTGSLGTGDF